ncbi:effector-associated domain 2-containing protein [Thermomonospora amylolytica]|uniref:effector-associated domain 2-containing protein n=1 Tax=Thermomonospora amylolytica TaxID=1411117 RepID=UPI000E6D4667|nr:hypothetical protein [Thermomonospora amylolytica]
MESGAFGGRDGWRPAGKCALFVCDVAGFTDRARPEHARERIRTELYGMLQESFERSGLPPESCYHEDRGDGVLVVLPPHLDPALLVHPLIDRLRGRLQRYDDLASEVARIRLRVALHLGRAKADAQGLVGADVDHAFRLLDAPQFKTELRESDALLGVLVSQALHDEVIRDAHDLIDPDLFRPLPVSNKGTETTGWLRLCGRPRQVAPGSALPATPDAVVPEPVAPAPSHESPLPPDWYVEPTVRGLFEVVDRLLDIPLMVTPEGRSQVVESLPREIRIRIARRPQPHMDGMSIVRTCAEYPGGLPRLLLYVRAFAGPTPQVMALQEAIVRIGEDG